MKFRHLILPALLCVSATTMAADTGMRWRATTTMSGMGMNMPPRSTEFCASGKHQDQPPPTSQKGQECEYTEMSRDGGKVHFAMQCKNNTKGTGDMVYSDGHYSGKFIIESPQGTMNISTEGEKLGTCDPAKTR